MPTGRVVVTRLGEGWCANADQVGLVNHAQASDDRRTHDSSTAPLHHPPMRRPTRFARYAATTVLRLMMAALLAAVVPRATAAQRPLKVYISVDMEGIAGVVTSDQLGPTGFEYDRAREFMTGEALAAIAGAKEAGATEIVVSDSHGNGESLLIDRFPDDVRIVRSWPR